MRLEASRFLAESYFEFQSDNAVNNVGTSKKLFSKHASKPSATSLAAYLAKRPSTAMDDSIEKLNEWVKQNLFPQWHMQLLGGYNLALLGYGSKKLLLHDFTETFLGDRHVFRLEAYSKNASYLSLLHYIAENLLKMERVSRRLDELTDQICDSLSSSIVLVIEMADAPCMRSVEVWSSLARLASLPSVQLILTVEHVNAMLLNTEDIWSSLHLAWHDATTMVPYSEELLCTMNSRKGSTDGESKWKGAQFVLTSLTNTARNVFKVLAEHQLAQSNRPAADSDDEEVDQRGMGVVTWFQNCQERFLVSNELAFRTQLTEFVDHELIRSVDDSGQNGTEFYIPFERLQIEELLEICKAS
ncbi:hypothetical protein PSACC_00660 [Paramicrosporidium saccamoebae]|uniref:Origin recognition complex subunit 2 n=1 Tax=Paramicrosporidium saccamoebae TaxID=1246581 RepID=A0A2H9TP63_9FUNG|nr:hypothetical protein PSACC_00660 [Paramicrosporidium saccamoebae]